MSRHRSAWSRIRRASACRSGDGAELRDQLRARELDGGERGAELVRRGRHHAAEVGQLLLAPERHLGREQRLRHHLDLVRHAVRVEAEEQDPDHDREPEAELEQPRHREAAPVRGAQRQVQDRGEGDEHDRGRAHEHRDPQRQRRGRDHDRRDDEEGEGVVEPAGQEDQERELHEVEEEERHRLGLRQAPRLGEHHGEDEVRDDRGRDRHDAGAQRQREAEVQLGHRDGRDLSADRHPAQHDQGPQPDAVDAVGAGVEHGGRCDHGSNPFPWPRGPAAPAGDSARTPPIKAPAIRGVMSQSGRRFPGAHDRVL